MVLEENEYCIVMLGPSYTIKDIEELLVQYSSSLRKVKIILLVKKTSTGLLRDAMRLNIHDVVELPFNYSDINESFDRATKLFKESSSGDKKEPGKEEKQGATKITVFSTKGGSGKSFIATNLAADLINLTKERVTLFDLNYQFGDVALMLNLFPKHTIYDIVSVIDQLDSEMLSEFLTEHESGVKVLPAPIDPTQDESISTAHSKKVLNILSQISDYIIIDTPSGFTDNVLLLLEETDYLLMVTSMDVPSIKNLKITLQLLEQLKFPDEKIFLVLNRAGTKVGITEDEIKKTIGKKINVTIPSDRLVPLTINKGTPLVKEAPRSRIARSIRKLSNIFKNT
jgi:pilus assembly protein CpaE